MAGERRALLIATGTYDNATLRALRSPVHDAEGLAAVLRAPQVGNFEVTTLLDLPAYQITRALETFFRGRGREDLLLVHISCHGIKDDDGQLHFAARDTDKDLPASTAVPAGFLHAQIERCRARSIVVLLDCCYSGAYLPGAKRDDAVHVEEELAGHGVAVLTATSRTEYAWEGEVLEQRGPTPSRFTGAVIEGLRSGAADIDGDGRITVTELYDYVYETLRHEGARQTPRMHADLQYQVVIARVPLSDGSPVVRDAFVSQPLRPTRRRRLRWRPGRRRYALGAAGVLVLVALVLGLWRPSWLWPGTAGSGSKPSPAGAFVGLAGKCLDAAGPNAPVRIQRCNGSRSQHWTVGRDDTIRALGQCLDALGGGTGVGTRIRLHDCNDTGAQHWTYNAATHDIVNLPADKCLDVLERKTTDNTPTQIWDCTGGSNQKWELHS
ncbi:ricin-type beta-trefoil lectin domain protein [Streptomyces sp. NPDC057654]|uniref:caspase, EACC1-associated type n=1 Tax=Streptomyces sp. NPDC057654 TaxID=3346196 RepID=UPI00368E4BF8